MGTALAACFRLCVGDFVKAGYGHPSIASQRFQRRRVGTGRHKQTWSRYRIGQNPHDRVYIKREPGRRFAIVISRIGAAERRNISTAGSDFAAFTARKNREPHPGMIFESPIFDRIDRNIEIWNATAKIIDNGFEPIKLARRRSR